MFALALVWRGGAQRGVKGDVVGFAIGRPGLDVASAFAVGAGAAAPPALAACQLVERGVEPAHDLELAFWLDLLPAIPPVRRLVLKDVLAGGLGLSNLGVLFVDFRVVV
jgi:hypothetical protein